MERAPFPMRPSPFTAAAVACLALALGGPSSSALAQEPPAASSPSAEAPEPLSELVVIAHPPGPALWRAQLGDSSVIILGAVTPVPHRLVWDQRQVIAALDGANLLLTQPRPDLGPLQVLGLVTGNLWRVRSSRPLEPSLPPDLRKHFEQSRNRARTKESRYANWKPAVAGFLLLSDFRRSVGLSEAKPASTVEHLAEDRHIPIQPLASYPMNQLLQLASRLDEKQGLNCLDDALNELEYEGQHPQDIDDDWARGDVLAVAKRYQISSQQYCLEQAPGARALIDRQMGQATDRIWAALHKPGKSVAVIDMAWLLPANGVLNRLRGLGATIGAPAAAP
ncbi:MAG: GumN family protein [Caulobacteraceae bacterium]|nr:GumN family protein [Caulobacteraceae bacterium]